MKQAQDAWGLVQGYGMNVSAPLVHHLPVSGAVPGLQHAFNKPDSELSPGSLSVQELQNTGHPCLILPSYHLAEPNILSPAPRKPPKEAGSSGAEGLTSRRQPLSAVWGACPLLR